MDFNFKTRVGYRTNQLFTVKIFKTKNNDCEKYCKKK